MSRSLWKGPFIENNVLRKVKKVEKIKNQTYKLVRIWSRNSVIFRTFVGLNFEIYNGKKFISLLIKKNMVGLKFGEFVPTRKAVKHK